MQINKTGDTISRIIDRLEVEDPKLIKLIKLTIKSVFGAKHEYYERVNDLADLYRAISTGEGQDYLISSYKEKETVQQKKNRVAITNTRTKGVVSKIEAQFDRIYRQPKILDSFSYMGTEESNEDKRELLSKYVSNFNGMGSVDEFLKDIFISLNITDPNSFLLVSGDEQGIVQEPIIISSAHALNYKYENNILKYFVSEFKFSDITEYYSYISNWNMKVTLIDKKVMNEYEPKEGQMVIEVDRGKLLIEIKETGMQGIPVFRVGTCKDKVTYGKTCVSIIDPAINEFKDLINVTSEYALNLKLHLFLQKIQKGNPCEFTDGVNMCDGGVLNVSGDTCPSCEGDGFQVLTTSQDVLIVSPTDDQGNTMSVRDYAGYVELPFQLVEHQKQMMSELVKYILEVIFGVDVSQITNTLNASTATEVLAKVDSLNAVLAKQASYMAQMKAFIINQLAINLGIEEGLGVSIQAPNTFNVLSINQLISMLKLAKEAGSPSDVIERIEMDIREKQNEDNPALNKVAALRNRFEPFKSIQEPLKSSHIMSLPELDRDRILYLYQDEIYRNVVSDSSILMSNNIDSQYEAILSEVEKIKDRLERSMPISLNIQDLIEDGES